MKANSLIFGVLLTLCMSLRSELPPEVYEEMKQSAPEFLMIKVSAVTATTDTKGRETTFTYDAIVIQSMRSKTGIKTGDKIGVLSRHHIFGPGEVGPSNPRTLKKGETVAAYLARSRKEGVYTIAAGGHSFEKAGKGANLARPIARVPVPLPEVIAEPPPPEFDPDLEVPGEWGPEDHGMPMPQEMFMDGIPGRFQLLSANVQQNGKRVPMTLKIDTMTGQVWHLKMKARQILVNGRPKMETVMVFEAIDTEGPFFEATPQVDEVEAAPAVPVPVPPRPFRRR